MGTPGDAALLGGGTRRPKPALLAALAATLGRFDGLVTYNGTGFELPLLETRFVLGRQPRRALDTLMPAP